MAVAAVATARSNVAEYARDAQLARVVALVIDMLLLGVITTVVNGIYGIDQAGGARSIGWPALTVIGLLYFAVPEAMFGASPGKLRTRLRVVRVDGRPLDVTAVVIRNVLKPIDFLPVFYLLGGASVVLTPQSQRIGDLVAGTTVVYRHRAAELGGTLHASDSARRTLLFALAVAVVFTVGFQYFGRPALAVQGLLNNGELVPGATAYSLGQAQWSPGSVTFPFTTTGATANTDCEGTVTLGWMVLLWNETQASWTCKA
jgi:uncharacterized RDD family membrane protein YckC